eukprot:TRINITY_DN87841_c0_g1_i3.p1 TRINITY_DN87841_c0_g1~~TRINITY_DN87841_c0_g1_i3.p1  ORF type:complete len:453 (+),score=120.02 TRINITY_DN87841_c0_g1_i3:72-1430(+)
MDVDTKQNAPLIGEKKRSFFNPRSFGFRILILIGCMFMTFGDYFAYDNPGAMQDDVTEQMAMNSTTKYTKLYSVYSFPNTIQPFVGGLIIDKWLGLRLGTVIFAILILIGQTIVSISAQMAKNAPQTQKVYYMALLGRFVFGLGGESLTVTQSTYCARWFSGKELATAFAIVLSFARVGSAVNFSLEPAIEKSHGLNVAMWFSAFTCLVSLIFCFYLWYLDKKGAKAGVVTEEGAADDEEVHLRDIKKVLGLREVLIYLICVFFYMSVFIFIQVGKGFFQKKFPGSASHAGNYLSIPYTVSAFLSPFLGFFVDRVGRHGVWVVVSSFGLSMVHFIMADTMTSPVVMMIAMGVCYSCCAASLWPMVSLVVELKYLGTSYGLMTSVQNLGLALAPFLVGHITGDDPTLDNYESVIHLFAYGAFFSFILRYSEGLGIFFVRGFSTCQILREKRIS